MVDVATVLRELWSRERLRIEGWSPAEIRRALERGQIIRIRKGWYVFDGFWKAARPEDRHLAQVVAAQCEMRDGDVAVSHISAAVVHGLPYLGSAPPDRVHVTMLGDGGASGTANVRRHTLALPEEDVEVVHGIRCTTLARTVFDVARSEPLEQALAILDAALAAAAVEKHTVDAMRDEAWRESLRERCRSASGPRGLRKARWLIEFADGRAQRPGESVSRLQLHRLGFRPRLQVPVLNPRGGRWWVDFALDEAETFAEFDGAVKYLDPAMRGGRTAEQVVLEEKRREDAIRGVTGWRTVRWGMSEARSPEALARHLASFSVPLPESNDVVSTSRRGLRRNPVSFR